LTNEGAQDPASLQARLIESEKLASLGRLTAGIVHEIRNPLNFINNLSETSAELVEELEALLAPHLGTLDEKTQGKVEKLLGFLSADLKIIEKNGKRAESIVKTILLQSRKETGNFQPTDINTLLGEAWELAFQGERANDPTFQVVQEADFGADLHQVKAIPEDMMRVFINLFSNAFYATKKRNATEQGSNYQPTVSTSTQAAEGGVEIRIRDNGTGIPEAVKAKLFSPFFTTKPAGDGTGLGLSICHDIVTKQHAGRIEVISAEGEFTEFVLWLPEMSNT